MLQYVLAFTAKQETLEPCIGMGMIWGVIRMFDIGLPELIIILVVALLVFGPGKLAEIGRELGRGVREFRKATTDLTREFNEALKEEIPQREEDVPRPTDKAG